MINQEIEAYIQQNILPAYQSFDQAHNLSHAEKVIANSLSIAAEYGAEEDMAYVIAAYHDVGLTHGRERHEITSGAALSQDEALRQWFTAEEIQQMAEAVEDHRASGKREPRSLYGKIIAEADRDIDYETILRRCIQYSLANFPAYDFKQHFERVYHHMQNKYGENGYMKLWLSTETNRRRLAELRLILPLTDKVRSDFTKLFSQLTMQPS